MFLVIRTTSQMINHRYDPSYAESEGASWSPTCTSSPYLQLWCNLYVACL